MDADCLIKLTKAGLKEEVCEAWRVVIPAIVRRETVEQAPRLPDAARIQQNIVAGRIAVNESRIGAAKGEAAALRLYRGGGFDAVASDDARFIKQLRGLGVPYAVPAVVVVWLCRDGVMTADRALEALVALRPHISPDQHAAAVLMISGGMEP